MDLLDGITKKARCYRAYILMDKMHKRRGEGRMQEEGEGKTHGEEVDQGGRDIRGNTTAALARAGGKKEECVL